TIFGFGNYVKTMVIPAFERFFPVVRIHELDPWQIGPSSGRPWSWDTSPSFGDEETADVVVIAGYHHHHVPLALEAIRRKARAVIIEKPIATTDSDLQALSEAMEASTVPVFCAFQRRYSPFNHFVRKDLATQPGEPVSYLATVFEVNLPPLHWYTWPNSRSRLTSNGCHWIDHFLFLNDFSPLADVRASSPDEYTTLATLSLENGATLVLTLTSRGSHRLGVRDHCELRAGSRTVVISDGSRYKAESSSRPLRYRRTHRYAAHEAMYRSFGERIVVGAPGDTVASVRSSGQGVLQAEEALMSR
ncbi:MAG: Gfo/Idh/MocA family oxidoreductase, partial [Actinomycetota bacterium]|nr:Gfo/Idh/MocA family oxidoreductase [Actinomycetota bacterium]